MFALVSLIKFDIETDRIAEGALIGFYRHFNQREKEMEA